MPRGGDNLILSFEVIARETSQLTVTVLTKNSEDMGDGTAISGATSTSTATGVFSKEVASDATNGIAELIRYKFEPTTSGSGHFVLFRALDPVWFDSVDAF